MLFFWVASFVTSSRIHGVSAQRLYQNSLHQRHITIMAVLALLPVILSVDTQGAGRGGGKLLLVLRQQKILITVPVQQQVQ
jgi:hypothetical protein